MDVCIRRSNGEIWWLRPGDESSVKKNVWLKNMFYREHLCSQQPPPSCNTSSSTSSVREPRRHTLTHRHRQRWFVSGCSFREALRVSGCVKPQIKTCSSTAVRETKQASEALSSGVNANDHHQEEKSRHHRCCLCVCLIFSAFSA